MIIVCVISPSMVFLSLIERVIDKWTSAVCILYMFNTAVNEPRAREFGGDYG